MKLPSVFKAASATFALIPGIAIILKALPLPPSFSNLLFGGIVEAMGVLSLLLLTVSKEKIKSYSLRKVMRVVIIMGSLFIVSFFVYFFMMNSLEITNEQFNVKIFFPLWNNQQLQDLVNRAGSRNSAITQYGPMAIRDVIMSAPNAMIVTKIILGVLYLLIFEFLVLSFGIAGNKLSPETMTNFTKQEHRF